MSVKIINDGYPTDNEVLVDTVIIKYWQDNDCTEGDEEGQELTIESRDGGGGKFLHLKTKGWSISDESDLIPILEHFKNICGQS